MSVRRSWRVALAIAAAIVMIGSAASAAEWYVDDDAAGNPVKDGSLANPFDKIGSAITAAAASGDTIHVAAGTYIESVTWSSKSVHVLGAGAGSTIVTAPSGSRGLTAISVPAAAVLEGVTFSGNNSPLGAGMYLLTCGLTVRDCEVTANTGGSGAGIYIDGGSPVVANSFVTGNTASSAGGGLYIKGASTATLLNLLIAGNSATSGGGGIYVLSSSPGLTNNTITNNNLVSAGSGGAGVYIGGGTPALTNSIVWGNTGSNDLTVGSGTPSVSYSDIGTGGIGGTGNISADPLFTGPGAGDYTLTADSPCKDAGTNSAVDPASTDLAGNPRIANGTVDMGAYEYANQPPVAVDDAATTDEDTAVTIPVLDNDFDPDLDPLTIDFVNAPDHGSAAANPDGTVTYTPDADYYGSDSFNYGISDGKGGTAFATVTVTITPVNDVPVVGLITAPLDPQQVGTTVEASAPFADADPDDTHTAEWDWGDTGTSAGTVTEADGAGTVTGSHAYTVPGVYTVTLTVTDGEAAQATAQFQYIVVYDPEGGFVTGGGWIQSPAGACETDPTLVDKASFGFNSKYKKGATVPTGQTNFQFQAAGLHFESTAYDWLVIAGAKAKYKGTGTINGEGEFKFMLTAIDGALPGGGGVDKFRIKIWYELETGEEVVVYDNQMGESDDSDAATALGGGSIVIHKAK